MGKKAYSKPLMLAEKFIPQEYCAVCGDGTTMVTYTFWCDAGYGRSFYVWLDNHILGGDAEGDWESYWGYYYWEGYDEYIGRFHACQTSHSVTVPKGTSIDDVFPRGLISNNMYGVDPIPVRIWRGEDGNNIHCTTRLQESEYTPHNPS
ncbi:MAG: hypothetical protein IKH88_08555 [Prevotella sp.]|nr:hypothetical protein [Prevotella sp.]